MSLAVIMTYGGWTSLKSVRRYLRSNRCPAGLQAGGLMKDRKSLEG